MINFAVEPREVATGRPVPVRVRLENVGSGPCSRVRVEIASGPVVLLVSGDPLIRARRLEPGEVIGREVVVRVPAAGHHRWTFGRLTYRDESGTMVTVRDPSALLVARTATRSPETATDVTHEPCGRSVFVSYRRSDSEEAAHRLAGRLEELFPGRVFHDRSDLRPGDLWADRIAKDLEKCGVLVAVIGSRWLSASTATGRRRLDEDDDVVRLEIATAVRRGIPIVPVLLDTTPMPPTCELPGNIKGLTRHHAERVSSDGSTGFSPLVDAVGDILGCCSPAAST